MRLIDADAILKKLKQSAEIFLCGRDFKDLLVQDKARVDEIYNCQAEIINAPTIDRPASSQFKRMAVQLGYAPVVYCKNCKHRDPEDERCDCGCWHTPFTTNDDDFCSYGERRENR